MRQMYEEQDVSYAKLATLFGLKPSTVSDILKRKHWKWVI